MKTRPANASDLTLPWLALVALTLISLLFGEWRAAAPLLPILMAIIVWVKSAIVANRFIEANQTHPFIRRLVHTFIALAPVALVLITFFGPAIQQWTALD